MQGEVEGRSELEGVGGYPGNKNEELSKMKGGRW